MKFNEPLDLTNCCWIWAGRLSYFKPARRAKWTSLRLGLRAQHFTKFSGIPRFDTYNLSNEYELSRTEFKFKYRSRTCHRFLLSNSYCVVRVRLLYYVSTIISSWAPSESQLVKLLTQFKLCLLGIWLRIVWTIRFTRKLNVSFLDFTSRSWWTLVLVEVNWSISLSNSLRRKNVR